MKVRPHDTRREEERRKLILESALDAVITMDASGNVLDWNHRAETLFGWRASEVVGTSMAGVVIPERFRAAHERGLRHFLETGEGPLLNRRLESEALRRDGSEFPAELTITPGRIGGEWVFSSFIRDLTDRKAAENRLVLQSTASRILWESRTAAEAVDSLLEGIGSRIPWEVAAFWSFDPATRTLRMSAMRAPTDPAAEAFLRESRNKPPQFAPDFPEHVLERGQPVWMLPVPWKEYSRSTTAEACAFLSAFGFPVATQDGVLGIFEFHSRKPIVENTGLAETLTDIGRQLGQFLERKRAEDELRHREEQLQTIIDGVPALVSYIGTDRHYRCNNKAYEEWFGHDRSEVTGKPMWEVLGQAAYDKLKPKVDAALAGEHQEWEATVPYQDGGTRHVRAHYLPHRRDGLVDGFVVLVMDLTRQKEDADRLRVTEEHLRQSQRMEAIGRLSGGIAHDFNNLLTAINGYSGLLADGLPRDSPEAKMAAEIHEAGEKAAKLTGQLLAFSRKQVLNPGFLELNEVVEGMLRLMQRLIGENIRLETRLEAGLPRVLLDRGRLEQIILNLCLNARDAMPTGGTVTLESRLTASADPGIPGLSEPAGRVVLLVVKYTGKGTGLGLSTVFGIVQQSGGSIAVESGPGSGSEFTIRFPVPQPGVEPRMEPLPHRMPAAPVTAMNILLVEDDEGVRRFTEMVLKEKGHQVLVAGVAETALEMASSRNGVAIDLLISDSVLPGMDGWELARRLSASRPGMRVILMTGYTTNEGGAHPLQAAYPLLEKPFSRGDLEERIAAAFS